MTGLACRKTDRHVNLGAVHDRGAPGDRPTRGMEGACRARTRDREHGRGQGAGREPGCRKPGENGDRSRGRSAHARGLSDTQCEGARGEHWAGTVQERGAGRSAVGQTKGTVPWDLANAVARRIGTGAERGRGHEDRECAGQRRVRSGRGG